MYITEISQLQCLSLIPVKESDQLSAMLHTRKLSKFNSKILSSVNGIQSHRCVWKTCSYWMSKVPTAVLLKIQVFWDVKLVLFVV